MSTTSHDYEILGLGCVAVDELVYVREFPRENEKVEIESRATSCGGTTANALVAAARLGARCAYAGSLGHDEASEFASASLATAGVDVRYVREDSSAQPIRCTIIVNSRRSSRTVFYQLEGAAPLDASWPPEEAIVAARVLLIDQFGMEGMLRAAQIARSRQIPVVADFERPNCDGFEELLALVDHLILPHELAAEITGRDDPSAALARLWSNQREAVVVTCAEKGCWYHGEGMPENVALHYPAFWVDASDTTGCGDVFRGAYATALLENSSLEARLRFASAAAALKATKTGGQQSFPGRDEVEAFLIAEGR